MVYRHRRRIELEDEAKVVAYGCGAEFVQFLAALALVYLKETVEFILFLLIDRGKTASAARN